MLANFRNTSHLEVPDLLKNLGQVDFSLLKKVKIDPEIQIQFPSISFDAILTLMMKDPKSTKPLKVGAIFSGGPAPGGHNVLLGLFEALKEMDHHSEVIGYQDGMDGFLSARSLELNHKILLDLKNIGGFYLLGSSRKKIRDQADFQAAKERVVKDQLDALIVIGGDDSNTNGALLADFFINEKIKCQVIGIPKTIDGDLQHECLEISFGFDTASKVYSEMIGNILNDAKSAKKYYHFIKLMGRSASHLALECALITRPNYTFISEEMKLNPIHTQIDTIVDFIVTRSLALKNYGCILIPEGLLEFIPEFQNLVAELNQKKIDSKEKAIAELSQNSLFFFKLLPAVVQNQIFLERDPHGNIPLSQIQTELVIVEWVKNKLKSRADFKGKFAPIVHFLGYEGRSAFPTQFDCEYTYALGRLAAKMVASGLTGYMAGFKNLKEETINWMPCAIPLASMMHFKQGDGDIKPVIEKTYVDLSSKAYQELRHAQKRLAVEDGYICPGPIQFFGPKEIVNQRPKIID